MICTFSIICILISTLTRASHIAVEGEKNLKTHLTDEQKEKFLEIISTDPQNVKTSELVDRYASCLQNFDEAMDNVDKGWGWSSTSSDDTCVSVGQSCQTDYRNSTDSSTNSMKTPKEENKGWGSSHGWPSNSSSSTSQSSKCCNEDICHNHRCCTPTPATPNHSPCSSNSDCCLHDQGKAVCDSIQGICLTPLGKSCSATSECYAGVCEDFCCYPLGNCKRSDVRCTSDKQCCGNGECVDGTCLGRPGDSCAGCDSSCKSLPCTDGICCIKSGSCELDDTVCCPGFKCANTKGVGMGNYCMPDAFQIM